MAILPLTESRGRDIIDIMKTERFLSSRLVSFFRRCRIATLEQVREALGNPTERTAFRKLRTLDYLSSYSHRGMYYTLQGIAKFDAKGLWSCQSVWFSRFGSLVQTAKTFVQRSEAGYSSVELNEVLHVVTKHALVGLVRAGELKRERIEGRYIYFSPEPRQCRSQQKVRKGRKKRPLASWVVANVELAEAEAKAVVLLFISTLDERQRRLYAGLESLKLGRGGDCYIAELFGMDPHTVGRGRHELTEGKWDAGRIRAAGGGRTAVEKKAPES